MNRAIEEEDNGTAYSGRVNMAYSILVVDDEALTLRTISQPPIANASSR